MSSRSRGKIKIDPELLRSVLQYRQCSIRGLGNNENGFGWSSKSIGRALRDGEMSRDLLDAVSRYLDIDPDYIQGKYHEHLKTMDDQEVVRILGKSLHPSKFPYIKAQQREMPGGKFLEEYVIEQLLVLHNISPEQYRRLDPAAQLSFDADLERAIAPVILKHFPTNALGKDSYDDAYRLLVEIESAKDDLHIK